MFFPVNSSTFAPPEAQGRRETAVRSAALRSPSAAKACASLMSPFTLMRFKSRFSAVVEPQRTAGNRKHTAKRKNEPY